MMFLLVTGSTSPSGQRKLKLEGLEIQIQQNMITEWIKMSEKQDDVQVSTVYNKIRGTGT